MRLLAVGQFAALLVMLERPAHAYVDPGSGLLAFQMVGASTAGALFFLRRKLRQLFKSQPSEGLGNTPSNESATPSADRKERADS